MFRILLHVFVKMENMQQVLWVIQKLFVIKVQMQKESPKDDGETNFNENKATCKTNKNYILLGFLLITIALFINYQYLLLSDKISSKAKTFITISRQNNPC